MDETAAKTLLGSNYKISDRFRALFCLKSLGGQCATSSICNCLLSDCGSLLQHELAYVLGQMGNAEAIDVLLPVLLDRTGKFESIVRHEAGEALGAILLRANVFEPKRQKVISALHECSSSNESSVEVSETCQLALSLVAESDAFFPNAFGSVDPALPHTSNDVAALRELLLSESRPLYERFRAMFALRDLHSQRVKANATASAPELDALIDALGTVKSALFRHELCFVLGQLADARAASSLADTLADVGQHCMVRHEAAEALVACAPDTSPDILRRYVNDPEPVVRDSCIVALDMQSYFTSDFELQYAVPKPIS